MSRSKQLDWEKAYAEFWERHFLGTLKRLVFDVLKCWCTAGEKIDILALVQSDKCYKSEIYKIWSKGKEDDWVTPAPG